MSRGKLIALEGIDGSGKRTQLDLLTQALSRRGLSTIQMSFPKYGSFFGKLVAQYLNGEFGSLEVVDPHFSALLYAGDRFDARGELETALSDGATILVDRYIGSNLAHQTARVPPDEQDAFMQWLKHLEYRVYGLPLEDLNIYLRVSPGDAHRLIGMKGSRDYTSLKRDIHEADVTHLQRAAAMYDRLAKEPNWIPIECADSVSGKLLSPEEIHAAVLEAVELRAFSRTA